MKYPYTVYQAVVEGHTFWIARCPSLKGCVGQGETIEEALNELEANEAEWIVTAEECGIEVPPIPVVQETVPSGKFTVRVSPSVHQLAIECAHEQGISLNQYINDAIVSYNAQNTALKVVKEETRKTILQTLFSFSRSTSGGSYPQQVSPRKPLVPRMVN